MTRKTKRPTFTSPVATLGWPCAIDVPDAAFADDKNPNDLGEYKARLVMPKDSPECKKFLAEIEAIYEQGYQEACTVNNKKSLKTDDDYSRPWDEEKDRETDEPTGNMVFRFRLGARVEKKDKTFFDQRPKVFDSDLKLMSKVPPIGPGSKVQIAGQAHCWYTSKFGMTLWLEAVKLVELVEKTNGRSATDYGFGEEEGGYTEEGAFADAAHKGDF